MAGRIPQTFIDDLLSRLDIVDVVTSRVRLKKTGKNYSACCPFHNENTPSFTVSPDKQFYYCFGCGASGSALKFVMEFDGLSFPDAVDKLAGDLSIEVPRESGGQFQRDQQAAHEPLYKLMGQAMQFFEQQLRSSQHKDKAIQYLQGRGLSGQAAKFFAIGFAPPGWDNLQKTVAPDDSDKRNETIRQLISCGMTIEKDDGRTYDRFRDRVMFPIRNARGQVIAFGGRVLGDEKPKYLNSPETPIFHKNQELYGLYEARKIRQKLVRMIIVEGYMDVVALAEFGIHYAVATLGTATSEHHIRRLFKIVPEIIFCFDGDEAGRTAAKRAMETVLPALKDGLQARFLFLPEGEDPDTLVRKEGKEAFEKRLDHSDHLPEFLFAQLKEQVDFDSLDGKARLGQLAAPLISRLPNGMLKELMQQKLSEETGINEEKLAKLLPTEEPPVNAHTQQPSSVHTQQTTIQSAQPPLHTPLNQPPQYIPDTHSEYDHPENASPDADYYPPDSTPGDDLQLKALINRALRLLTQHPGSAGELEDLTDISGEDDQEMLLLQLVRELKKQPQSGTIGLLTIWTGRPFFEEIRDAAQNTVELPGGANPAVEINGIINRLLLRQLRREWQTLQEKVASTGSLSGLSAEEKKRYVELPRQLKQHKN